MRNLVLTLMTALLSCSAAQAFWPEAAESTLQVGVAYRQDSLEYKIRAEDSEGSGSGDCSRKFKWDDLRIWQLELAGRYVTCDNLYLRGSIDFGWIVDGKLRQHHEFASDDCSCEDGSSNDFKLHVKADDGHVYDAKIALGYVFTFCDDSLSLAPVIGYGWNGQHIKLKHHHDSSDCSEVVDCTTVDGTTTACETTTCDATCSESGSGNGRHRSKFNTRWNGPFLGVDFGYRFCCDWMLFANYEFHWVDYHGRFRSGLEEDNCHAFRQNIDNAHGQVFGLGVKWAFCDCWTATLSGEWQWWDASSGHERSHHSRGPESECESNVSCVCKTRLKDLERRSGKVVLSLGMDF